MWNSFIQILGFVAHIFSNFSTLKPLRFFQVDDLLVVEEEIDIDVRSLETCAYSSTVFRDILNKIQKAVDDLSLKQYSNLHAWVGKLDEAVEAKLAIRLQAGIEAWTKALDGENNHFKPFWSIAHCLLVEAN